MATKKPIRNHTWYKATLTPAARNIFSGSFGSDPESTVYFTKVDVTPRVQKVIVAARMAESSIRMMTMDLALKCLLPGEPVSESDTIKLNQLAYKMKV